MIEKIMLNLSPIGKKLCELYHVLRRILIRIVTLFVKIFSIGFFSWVGNFIEKFLFFIFLYDQKKMFLSKSEIRFF